MYWDKRLSRERFEGEETQNLCYIHADLGAWIHLHTNMGVESDFQDNLSHERNSDPELYYTCYTSRKFIL